MLRAHAAMVSLLAILASACGSSGAASSGGADAAGPGLDGGTSDVTLDGPTDAGPDAPLADASVSDTGAPADAACPGVPAATSVDPTSTPLLAIQGEPGSPLGIYDPSLVYPAGAGGGVMSYSSVAPNAVHTRVAVTTDHGATFQYAAEPNQVTPVTVMVTRTDPGYCDAGPCSVSGVLWHEVSSLVADPGDSAAPYKLFVHSYVSVGSSAAGANLRRDWGYIGMHTAMAPDSWSSETKLLGWSSDATLSTNGAAQVLTALPELADCVAFTEPGAMVTPLGLDLALDCAYVPSPGVVKIRVVLLRSTDHAKTFAFVSTLVGADDFDCLPGAVPQVMGPDLFTIGGTAYVVVSPTGPVTSPSGGGYRGCATIPLADAATGTIARAANGAPAVTTWVTAKDGRFTGPCTYAEGATALGLVVPMQFSDQAQPWFRILRPDIAQP